MNLSDKEFFSKFSQTLKAVKLSQTQAQPQTFLHDYGGGGGGDRDADADRSYVFILNRKSGGIRAHYLCLHPHKGYLLPHIQSVTWTKLKGWVDFGSVVYNNSLYLMGGKDKDGGKYTSKMLRYDPSEDKWTQLSNMKRSKAYFTITVTGNSILITGGEASGGELLDVIESYHPLTDTWTVEGQLPEPRKNHSVAIVNNRIYICGGQGPASAFNNNLWELRREFKFVGDKETFFHQWYNDWNQCFSRKIQQAMLFSAHNKLFCAGGIVQGPTDDGRKLADEEDIDETNSDDEAVEEAHRQRERGPYVPTYIRILEEETKMKKRGPKTLTRTTRRTLSVDVGNNLLRYKNPYKGLVIERRLLQPRSGAATLTLGNRVYLLGGYRLEEESPYIPRVEYYHIKKKRWFTAFDLSTYDDEAFRDIDVHLLNVPVRNGNFKLLSSSYKYPCW